MTSFTEYLAARWAGDFQHRYAISKHHAWKEWRDRPDGDAMTWSCTSLREAAERYSWGKEEVGDAFKGFANSLARAISDDDTARCGELCLEIFRWGGVARFSGDSSRQWVERHRASGALPTMLAKARSLLLGGGSLEAFDGDRLLMNAAMTKVYAASAPEGQLIIYDGRVGGALGLLAREYLREQGQQKVPGELAFRWGPARATASRQIERNPSEGSWKFSSLYRDPRRHQIHAALVRDSSRLLTEASALVRAAGGQATPACFERALFMIGYDVRRAG